MTLLVDEMSNNKIGNVNVVGQLFIFFAMHNTGCTPVQAPWVLSRTHTFHKSNERECIKGQWLAGTCWLVVLLAT